MPSKALKKPVNKRRQNGKKIIKSQATKSKQKYEMEASPKEQISELEKEVLSIKINEFESKLSRKKQLCSYMEEEINIFETLYNEKQLLKSESMKLLNNAFEDFSTEIFLLDQEINDMQHSYNQILKEQKFCSSYKEKVRKLNLLEAKLEKKLFEAEKCSEEIPALIIKLEKLEAEATMKRETFLSEKRNIIAEFDICLLRIEEELNCTVNKIINDTSLKLSLLPIPYKTLFLSGMLSSAWFDSAVNCLLFLQSQNAELERKCKYLQLSAKNERKNLKEYFVHHDIMSVVRIKMMLIDRKDRKKAIETLLKPEKLKNDDMLIYAEQEFKLMLRYEKLKLHQHNMLQSMKSEMEKLENAIKSLEVSGETCFDKSYLVQVICKAGSILKEEL